MEPENKTTKWEGSEALIAFADKKIDLVGHLNGFSRGGEYAPLFIREETAQDGVEFLVWANAWVVTSDYVAQAEATNEHLQGKYFQHGFHPSYGISEGKPFYEPIYGGPLEPLVLGWSTDGHDIDATLSQEFERAYRLTRRSNAARTVWDSSSEGVDEVVIREKGGEKLIIIANCDFVGDFQALRNRWLLTGIYVEWGDRLRAAGGKHEFALKHVTHNPKLHYFGVPDDSGYAYVEIQGYFLRPAPTGGFSLDFGFTSVPESVRKMAEGIEFQTSQGRIRPWDARLAQHSDKAFYAVAIFDQEVLARYQQDPNAEVKVRDFGTLTVTTHKTHLSQMAFVLGTEYVSAMLGYFVVGVPVTCPRFPRRGSYDILRRQWPS